MARILLTGGRAPAALELARVFQRAGHAVFMAESLPHHLSESSRAIVRNFRVPPPRQQPHQYVRAIARIAAEQRIDLIIPTCEEVFYIAAGLPKFGSAAFVEPLEKLNMLHNKLEFSQLAAKFGLCVAESRAICGEADLQQAFNDWGKLVLKPVYSRFAAHTLIRPTREQALRAVRSAPKTGWLAQKYIPGVQICTYSVSHRGGLTAHTAYPSRFTAGQGATIAFEHIDQPQALAWVQRFVEATGFTGQIAFDFIETVDHQLYGLECNPRATSGVHLLASCPDFAAAFLDAASSAVLPDLGAAKSMLATAMLVYGLPASIRYSVKAWLSTFSTSRDVVFSMDDPLPALLQFRSILHYLVLARGNGLTALEASTYDIEWNGEQLQL